MALLNIKTRQTYLKELGYYTGEIDGKWGPLSKQATQGLQNDYFIRSKDRDGIYGNNTDILLKCVYNCKDVKNFKVTEFKCKCGQKYCTGYPAVIDKNLVVNLQNLRNKYGKAITITSGLRCSTWNSKQGGVSGSSHTKGKATDIYISGQSDSHNGRVAIVDYWDTLANAKYAYCNNYMKYVGQKSTVYKSSTMGNATHVNVN